MQEWSPEDIARAAGARLISTPATGQGPETVVIDSRAAGPGALFVGLRGANEDGGRFATQALANGAWGVMTSPEHAAAARAQHPTAAVIATGDPLRALQTLATGWRRHLNPHVIGVTGSTGKTSTKDLLGAVLSPHRRTVASRANFNTEIGVPLEILGAPQGTEVLVLEMAMRGRGQIKELAEIAEPDIGIIVSLGPVHLELLGSIEAIAATKAELIAALPATGTAIVPAGEPLLAPHLRHDIRRTVTFGPTGDVRLTEATDTHVTIDADGTRIDLDVPFTQAHLRTNLLAVVAAAQAIGVTPSGRVELVLSAGRGQRITLPNDILLIDDCYNANPMSMRAALDDLAATAATRNQPTRRVAVLGDMLELGPDERRFHEEIGAHAAEARVDVLITVGSLAAAMGERFTHELHTTDNAPEAAALTRRLLQPGDTVLVKASRGVGLELVCGALQTAEALA